MITFEEIKKDPGIRTYIQKADESPDQSGLYRAQLCPWDWWRPTASIFWRRWGTPAGGELVQIAAYLHDIGNLVNRIDHSQSGAVMAFPPAGPSAAGPLDIAEVVTAIGNHDEGTGTPVSPMAAALILADIRRPPQPGAQPGHQQV